MKRLSVVASALLLAGLSFNASAEEQKAKDTGWYVGGAISNVNLEVEDYDDSAAGFSAYGGHNFNHWFGLEAQLFVTGGLDDDGIDIGTGALSVGPKFTWAMNDTFSVYGKVGLAAMVIVTDTVFDDLEWTGFGVMYGVGVTAAVSESLRLRLGYEYTSGDLDADRSIIPDLDADISQIALGLHYQF